MRRLTRPRQHTAWEMRYALDKLAQNADESEWAAVLHGTSHVSVGTQDEAMAETGDEFATEDADQLIASDRLQGQEILQESRQGTVLEQLKQRKELLGKHYPFEIDGNSLNYTPVDLPVYELLLGICQAPSLTAAPFCELPRLFENLSLLAGRGYLGPRSQGYRTGWPRPKNVARFKALIADVKQRSGNHLTEWQWQQAEHLPEDPAPKFVKEDGLDVVVWRQWPDQRTGQLYLLGQCACGVDWLNKDKELDLNDFQEWFRLPRTMPLRSFFTPRHAVDPILNHLARTAGLVFDRMRIVQALGEAHLAKDRLSLASQIVQCLDIAKQALKT